jgi:hypothetical protein
VEVVLGAERTVANPVMVTHDPEQVPVASGAGCGDPFATEEVVTITAAVATTRPKTLTLRTISLRYLHA